MRYPLHKRFAILLLGATFVLCPQFVDDTSASTDWTNNMIRDLDKVPTNGSQINAVNRPLRDSPFQERANAKVGSGEADEATVSSGVTGMFRVLTSALVFLGLGYGLLLIIRKIRRKKAPIEEPNTLKLVESLWLGKGQRLMLVNVAGQQVLLGASGGAIQSLAVLDGENRPAGDPAEKAANDDVFPSMLKSEMKHSPRREPTYGRTGRLETREEEEQPSPKVSNERVKQILKRLNHL